MNRNMDRARRRGPRRHAWLIAVVVVVGTAQVGLAGVARADTPTTTDPPTTSPPSSSTSTTAGGPATTAPAGKAGDKGSATTVTIPALQPGGGKAPPGPPLADPTPHIRVLLAELEVIDGEKGVTWATEGVVRLQAAEVKAEARATKAAQTVELDERALSHARAQLATVATMAFMGAGGGVLSAVLHGSPDVVTQAREMVSSTIEVHGQTVQDTRTTLEHARDALAQARHDVSVAKARVRFGLLELHAREDTLTSSRTDLADADAGGTWALSIEGDSAFTAQELDQWFTSQGRLSEATVPIDQLTGFYVSEGAAEGIRGDMAFAQSMVETGSFSNPDTINFNNFAGIGHCDSCAAGMAFDTAQLGVRGQMQLLKSYAEKDPKYADPLVNDKLRGPAGCCQTWTQLTRSWASDPNYGPKILSVYAAMLEWLLPIREAEPGPPPAPVVSASLVATSTTTTSSTTTTVKR
ncbi:MAG TPA: glucosaminidase domain-containing protein [Acidimicrobiales bacterium]|nr:glucosaminidase domain-containing protein [Acidimicrobiales bacterium]